MLTKQEIRDWLLKNAVNDEGDCWINNKEVYSENFLNQEIEWEE